MSKVFNTRNLIVAIMTGVVGFIGFMIWKHR